MSKIKVGDLCVYDPRNNKRSIKYEDLIITMEAPANNTVMCKFMLNAYSDRVSVKDLLVLSNEDKERFLNILEEASIKVISSIRFMKDELSLRGVSNDDKIKGIINSSASLEDKVRAISVVANENSNISLESMLSASIALKEYVDIERVICVKEADETAQSISALNTARELGAVPPRDGWFVNATPPPQNLHRWFDPSEPEIEPTYDDEEEEEEGFL